MTNHEKPLQQRANYAPSSEPFYPSFSSAPISASDYSQAPAVGSGMYGTEQPSNPYSGMGYDLLPQDPADSPPTPHAPSLHHTSSVKAPTPTSEDLYRSGPPAVEDLYRAPGNPYADHSGRSAPSPSPAAATSYIAAPSSTVASSPTQAPSSPTPYTPPGQPGGEGQKKRRFGCLVAVIALVVIGGLIIQGVASFVSDLTSGSGSSSSLPTVEDTALEEGMCFDTLEYASGNELQPISCDEPHRFEVSENVTMPGTAYPGEEEVAEYGSDKCRAAASDLTAEYGTRPLTPHSLYPSEGTWNSGDRTITCFIAVAGTPRMYGSAHEGDLEVR